MKMIVQTALRSVETQERDVPSRDDDEVRVQVHTTEQLSGYTLTINQEL